MYYTYCNIYSYIDVILFAQGAVGEDYIWYIKVQVTTSKMCFNLCNVSKNEWITECI